MYMNTELGDMGGLKKGFKKVGHVVKKIAAPVAAIALAPATGGASVAMYGAGSQARQSKKNRKAQIAQTNAMLTGQPVPTKKERKAAKKLAKHEKKLASLKTGSSGTAVELAAAAKATGASVDQVAAATPEQESKKDRKRARKIAKAETKVEALQTGSSGTNAEVSSVAAEAGLTPDETRQMVRERGAAATIAATSPFAENSPSRSGGFQFPEQSGETGNAEPIQAGAGGGAKISPVMALIAVAFGLAVVMPKKRGK